jgi:hypothetical protein
MSEGAQVNEPAGEVVVYETPDGGVRVEVVVGDDTVWLTEAQMVDLFGRGQSVIARHIGNVFADGELPREGSMQILHRTSDGGRPAPFYNLDVVISVGYRVKPKRGTQFRIWATNVLRDHLMRGWTLNEKRLLARGRPPRPRGRVGWNTTQPVQRSRLDRAARKCQASGAR